ncbi:MAG: helix-turn-helix domain-containing protein [Cyclobacteriaceae bacterium]
MNLNVFFISALTASKRGIKPKRIAGFLFLLLSAWCSQAQVTVVLESLPAGTSGTDTIYLTGSFNDWNVKDRSYMLTRQLDGKFAFQFPSDLLPLEYKFTRGSWMKVETTEKNEFRPNRLLSVDQNGETIYVNIANWQDLGGARSIQLITFYYFAVGFLGLILLFFIYRTKKADPIKLRAFSLMNIFLILIFTGSVVFHLANIIWLAYMEMVFQVLLFVWGPLIYIYIKSFNGEPLRRSALTMFIPMLAMATLAILEINNSALISFMNHRWKGLPAGNVVILISAMTHVGIYLFLALRKARLFALTLRRVTNLFVRLFIRLSITTWIILGLSLIGFIMRWPSLITGTYDLVFIPFSGLMILQMYYLWKFPEILFERPHPMQPMPQDIQQKLTQCMKQDQVFKNPDLTIADLSEILGVKQHVLSRMLNESYGKNFRDYINTHRVEAFIELAEAGGLEKFTFLALAHEVGFNSKSTFNLAFKKCTNQSPREFFKLNK